MEPLTEGGLWLLAAEDFADYGMKAAEAVFHAVAPVHRLGADRRHFFTDGSDWFGLALGCLLLISGAAGIWRAIRLGIVIDADGLRVRNFDSRDQVISWNEVEAIGCRQIGERAGIPLLAPVLHARGDEVFVIRALGSYSPTGVDRRVQQLRNLQAAAQSREGAEAAVRAE